MKTVISAILLFLIPLNAIFGQNQKPNVVFIMADDLGYTDLSCYGNTYHRTPNIDSLAKRGLKFKQAYSACPVCSPSRAAIMTGKYPARLHLTNFIAGDRVDSLSPVLPAKWKKYLSPSETTLAEVFKSQGYATGMVGKWHLGTGDSTAPANQGFDPGKANELKTALAAWRKEVNANMPDPNPNYKK